MDYKAIENAINEFNAKDTLEFLKHKAFNLFSAQYLRNEMAPSDFLAKQQDIESFKIARLSEANNIKKSILHLLIKSKANIIGDGF